MARINANVERQLGKKDFLYEAELLDTNLTTGAATCGTLDVSRVKGGLIQFKGLAKGTIKTVKLYGTTERDADNATFALINLTLDATHTGLPQVTNITSTQVTINAGGISVNSASALTTQPILRIPDGFAHVQLRVTGTTTAGVAAKFFAKSY